MQFYLNGYKPGDPLLADSPESVPSCEDALLGNYDIVIVGCGPAGLILGAYLAQFPDIKTAIVERRRGPLLVGQADGVACRTLEILQAFGLATRVLDEAYRVNVICFWGPDPQAPSHIVRTGRVGDSVEGISEMPHVTVNQARLLHHLTNYMERSASRLRPHYGYEVETVAVEYDRDEEHPVRVAMRRDAEFGESSDPLIIRAKYVVGCDGARSAVRKAIGRELRGEISDTSWGVIDLLPITDFPDIRRKCVIRSANGANLLLIPREGGYLVRLYIELGATSTEDLRSQEDVTAEQLLHIANRALFPYKLVAKDIAWWSVYNVGQRLCERFDDVAEAGPGQSIRPRVFIAGDACHTHSAKAGQGMNISIADAWNLGWKLASVIRGRMRPELLFTYSLERQPIAKELIDFDREFSRAMGAPPRVEGGLSQAHDDAATYQKYFAEQLLYTTGTATHYGPSVIVGPSRYQYLAKGFPIGMRFHSAPVLRIADANRVQLGHVIEADGAWRLFMFAESGKINGTSRWRGLCRYLASEESPIRRFTPDDEDPDAVIDLRAVFPDSLESIEVDCLPKILLPRKGKLELIDYEKVFCAIPGGENIFDCRGIDSEAGCVVVVRPDQVVANILPLDAYKPLGEFFENIFLEAS